MVVKLQIYLLQILLHFLIRFLKSTKTLCIIRKHAFHHFRHAPVSVCLNFFQSFQGNWVYFRNVFFWIGRDWEVLVKVDYHERDRNVTHSLDVPALRMPHMPNEQNSLQRCLNIFVLANFVILGADSLDITLNGPMYLFLLFIELC